MTDQIDLEELIDARKTNMTKDYTAAYPDRATK